MNNELTSMTDQILYCGGINPGGLKKIEYVPTIWIESWPEFINDSNAINQQVILISGKNWLSASFDSNSATYTELDKTSTKGKYYSAKVKATKNIDTKEFSALMKLMERSLFVLKITDRNNNIRLIGTPSSPLKFTSSLKKGKKSGDNNGYTYEFFGDLLDRSPFYVF